MGQLLWRLGRTNMSVLHWNVLHLAILKEVSNTGHSSWKPDYTYSTTKCSFRGLKVSSSKHVLLQAGNDKRGWLDHFTGRQNTKINICNAVANVKWLFNGASELSFESTVRGGKSKEMDKYGLNLSLENQENACQQIQEQGFWVHVTKQEAANCTEIFENGGKKRHFIPLVPFSANES